MGRMLHPETLPFGKHKGQPLADVPTSYLRWLLDAVKLSTGLRAATVAELQARGVTLPAPPAPPPAPRCPRCGSPAMKYSWTESRNGQRQVRRDCVRCGTFAGFAPRTPPFTTEADRRASPTPILDALTRLEELDIVLGSDGSAVHFVGDGWRRCPTDLRDTIRQCNHQLARLLGKGAMT